MKRSYTSSAREKALEHENRCLRRDLERLESESEHTWAIIADLREALKSVQGQIKYYTSAEYGDQVILRRGLTRVCDAEFASDEHVPQFYGPRGEKL